MSRLGRRQPFKPKYGTPVVYFIGYFSPASFDVAGESTATAIGQVRASVVGTVSGDSTANAVSTKITRTAFTVSSDSIANAVGRSKVETIFTLIGETSTNFSGKTAKKGVGTATGDSTAIAYGRTKFNTIFSVSGEAFTFIIGSSQFFLKTNIQSNIGDIVYDTTRKMWVVVNIIITRTSIMYMIDDGNITKIVSGKELFSSPNINIRKKLSDIDLIIDKLEPTGNYPIESGTTVVIESSNTQTKLRTKLDKILAKLKQLEES